MNGRCLRLLCLAAAWTGGADADYARDRGLVQPPQQTFLAGKILRVYPARTSIGRSPGERNCVDLRTEHACIARYGEPQERRPAPGGEQVLVYYGSRQLWLGLADEQKPAGRERTEHVVRGGRVVQEHQIIQVVERGYSFAPSPPQARCEAIGSKWPGHCYAFQPLEPPPALARPAAALLQGIDEKALMELYVGLLSEPHCEQLLPGYAAQSERARADGDPRLRELSRWMRTSPEYVDDLAALAALHAAAAGQADDQLKDGCRQMLSRMSGPDPRFATPEQTWRTYLDALRRGDAEVALECLDFRAQRSWAVLRTLPPERLKAMADAIKGLHMTGSDFGEFREAVVARHDGQAGMVYFVQQGGNWKINDM